MRAVAGLDIGTTACKCTAFDGEGNVLAVCRREYSLLSQNEVDALQLWQAVQEVLCEIAEKCPEIEGIGVTSFGESFVVTDEEGQPLHPVMLYTDPRGAEECARLTALVGKERITAITGLAPHEMYSLPKLMWLKERKPELWKQVRHIFLMEDYIVYRLTGKAQIDYSLACRSLAFDLESLTWSKELLEAAGIAEALLPRPVPSGTVAGTLLPGICPLGENTKIVNVSHDQLAAAVGAGAFREGTAVDGAGTVQCLTPIFTKLPDAEALAENAYCIVPYVIPGQYVSYAFSYTGGALLQWFTENFCKEEARLAGAQGVNAYLESLCPKEPTGLLVLPHFAGAATPYMDTGSRGAILGLSTTTSLPRLYRGCMEGVSYEMYLNYRRMKACGIDFDHLYATGGGARSPMWMQMKADIFLKPVTALQTADAGTVGSAMLTGVAVGLFPSLEAAAEKMVRPIHTYTPDLEQHERYMKHFERYEAVYAAVRPLMEGGAE